MITTSAITTILELRAKHDFNRCFTAVIESHLGWENNTPGIGDSQWYGVMGIFIYHATCKVDTNARLEWFDDVKGARTTFATSYEELTLGVDWHPEKWVSIRPEIRGDFSDKKSFRRGQDRAELTLALDAIFKF
jgi:hypothetical protein